MQRKTGSLTQGPRPPKSSWPPAAAAPLAPSPIKASPGLPRLRARTLVVEAAPPRPPAHLDVLAGAHLSGEGQSNGLTRNSSCAEAEARSQAVRHGLHCPAEASRGPQQRGAATRGGTEAAAVKLGKKGRSKKEAHSQGAHPAEAAAVKLAHVCEDHGLGGHVEAGGEGLGGHQHLWAGGMAMQRGWRLSAARAGARACGFQP